MRCVEGNCIKDQTFQDIINVTHWLDEVDELIHHGRLPLENILFAQYYDYQRQLLKDLRLHCNSAIKNHLCHLTRLPWPVVSKLSQSLVGTKCFRIPNGSTIDVKFKTFPELTVGDIFLVTNLISSVYLNCNHIPAPRSSTIQLPSSFSFNSRYGLTFIGGQWFKLQDKYSSKCLIFHQSWSSLSQYNSADLFETIERIGRRKVIATENYMIAYYPTSIATLSVWQTFTVFQTPAVSITITDLQKHTSTYLQWKLDYIKSSYKKDTIILLLSKGENKRTLQVNLQTLQVVSDVNGWLLAANRIISVETFVNAESPIMGYTTQDLVINGTQIPINGFLVDIHHILLSDNNAALFHKIGGDHGWKVTIMSYTSKGLIVEGTLNYDVMDVLDTKENSIISWHLKESTLFCLTQWNSGKRLVCKILMLKIENNRIKPAGLWQSDKIYSAKIPDLTYPELTTKVANNNHLFDALIGATCFPVISSTCFNVR